MESGAGDVSIAGKGASPMRKITVIVSLSMVFCSPTLVYAQMNLLSKIDPVKQWERPCPPYCGLYYYGYSPYTTPNGLGGSNGWTYHSNDGFNVGRDSNGCIYAGDS